MRTLVIGQCLWLALACFGCQSGGFSNSDGSSVSGNDGGSEPINGTEEKAYKRAILKCYKTGGSRVVKIEGQLMCY